MICISIAPKSMRQAELLIDKASKKTELVEIRLENINNLNLEKIVTTSRVKKIITIRPNDNYSKGERIALLSEAIRLGAEYVDIELDSGNAAVKNILDETKKYNTKVILSYHNFKKVPRNLERIYEKLKLFQADIIKIAVFANDITDNLQIFKLLNRAKKERVNLIALCLSEKGEISRIFASKFGSYLTYCSLDEGLETATGQISIDKMERVFNYHQINKKTKIFGLAGNPISHSKGVYFHNEYFFKKKANAVYVNILVGDFKNFISLYKKYFSGLSITIPFKEVASKSVDQLSDEAKNIKSINTIIKKNNKLFGYNTDAEALLKILKDANTRGKAAAILGTGGTARTAIYCFKKTGANVIIFGRNSSKAKMLAKEFDCSYSNLKSLTEKFVEKDKIDILINTTTIGMLPNINSMPISPKILNKNMLVVDFVYTPSNTKLIKSAIKKGCKTINGLEIFEKQAKLQQKLFTSII